MNDANEILGIDPIDVAIAAIDEQIEKLISARETLEGIRGKAGTKNSTGAARPTSSTIFSHDSFFGMTVGDAAKKYLAAIKKTAPAPAIAAALLAGGWKTASKNEGDTIRAILSRHEGFVKINGEFGLSEWYPGRKPGLKPRPITQAASAETEMVVIEMPNGTDS